MIYRAKKEYFKAKIESENKDSKSLRQSLRDLGMPSKKVKTSSSTLGLKIDNEVCFDKATCAEKINEFYTTVASKFVEKLPKVSINLLKTLLKIFTVVKVLSQIAILFQLSPKVKF